MAHPQLHSFPLSNVNASDCLIELDPLTKKCSQLHPRWELKTGILAGYVTSLHYAWFLPWKHVSHFKTFNSLSSTSITEQSRCGNLHTMTSHMIHQLMHQFRGKERNSSLGSKSFKRGSKFRHGAQRLGRGNILPTRISTISQETIRLSWV